MYMYITVLFLLRLILLELWFDSAVTHINKVLFFLFFFFFFFLNTSLCCSLHRIFIIDHFKVMYVFFLGELDTLSM